MAHERSVLVGLYWSAAAASLAVNIYFVIYIIVAGQSGSLIPAHARYHAFSLQSAIPDSCNDGSYTLVDEVDGTKFEITLRQAEQFYPCRYLYPGNDAKQLAASVADFVGLSGNGRFAFLSADGDCNHRLFRILDKRRGEFVQKSIYNNCRLFQFLDGPKSIANQVAAYLKIDF